MAEESSILANMYAQELSRAEMKARTKSSRSNVAAGTKTPQEQAWFYIATVLLNLDETISKG